MVPMNSFFGRRMARKYTFVIGPAKLPIMVEKPEKNPVAAANMGWVGIFADCRFSV